MGTAYGGKLKGPVGILMVVTAPDLLKMHWLHAKPDPAAVRADRVSGLVQKTLLWPCARGTNTRSAKWFRAFNEIPAVLLIGIAILAVVKPF